MQQLYLPLRMDEAKQGPAAGVTPVLMPVQHGSLDNKKLVFYQLYLCPGTILEKVW